MTIVAEDCLLSGCSVGCDISNPELVIPLEVKEWVDGSVNPIISDIYHDLLLKRPKNIWAEIQRLAAERLGLTIISDKIPADKIPTDNTSPNLAQGPINDVATVTSLHDFSPSSILGSCPQCLKESKKTVICRKAYMNATYDITRLKLLAENQPWDLDVAVAQSFHRNTKRRKQLIAKEKRTDNFLLVKGRGGGEGEDDSSDSSDYCDDLPDILTCEPTAWRKQKRPCVWGETSQSAAGLEELPYFQKTPEEIARIKQFLQKSFIFEALHDETVQKNLITCLYELRTLPGAFVIKQGDRGDKMYFVDSGELEAIKTDNETQQEINKWYLGPNDTFGDLAILHTGEQRTFSVRAKTECKLWYLHRTSYNILLKHSHSCQK